MPGDKKFVVRPIPVLSVTGSFRATGDIAISGGGMYSTDGVTTSAEGHFFFVRNDVKFPAGPGHHHMKKRRDRNVWDDLL